jgi:hypothetical protein
MSKAAEKTRLKSLIGALLSGLRALRLYHVRSKDKGTPWRHRRRTLLDRRLGNLRTEPEPVVFRFIAWTSKKSPLRLAG